MEVDRIRRSRARERGRVAGAVDKTREDRS